ncbi:MAG: hypothetical protein ACM3PW_12190 [Chlamydiota bacterium]
MVKQPMYHQRRQRYCLPNWKLHLWRGRRHPRYGAGAATSRRAHSLES